jgi:spoIIIJ-associated protein
MNEYVGKTLEDALIIAEEKEECTRESFSYSVISETTEEVKILIYELRDVIKTASEYVTSVIESFKLSVQVKEKYSDGVITLIVNTSRNGVLIGTQGNTLQALITLTRQVIEAKFNRRYPFLIDVGTYKADKYERIIRNVKKIALDVLNTKQSVALEPMTSDERRVAHQALTDFKNIDSASEGAGKTRRIVISYKE